MFKARQLTPKALLTSAIMGICTGAAHADNVINDDLIVQFSTCTGNDCVNGESFGFDTLRLKENNLRIHFDDTSNSASFPSNDWRIVANDSGNGGASYLAIEDSTAGRIPFRVEAGAPVNTLYVEADGDVGIKTANPVVDLHIVEGNTPTVRLEQDGSDGFTPQTYDVAANESNFFIRDVTNGSKLFFRSKPGAPEDSIFIAADGDVGLGTDAPAGPLHVKRTAAANLDVLTLENNGATRIAMTNSNSAAGTWRINHADDGDLRVSSSDGATNEMTLTDNGDLIVAGEVFSTACPSPTPCAPDYVFEPDYNLMPIDQLAEFIKVEKHLPNIPSATELVGPINVTKMQMGLLEKVEELTLYILDQEERMRAQDKALKELSEKLAAKNSSDSET